jgi:cell division septum initiation protein DivIVA
MSNKSRPSKDIEEIRKDNELVQYRIKSLEEKMDAHDSESHSLFSSITDTQRMLAERVVALETNRDRDSEILSEIMNSNKLQSKLLTGVASTIVVTLLSLAFKLLFKV